MEAQTQAGGEGEEGHLGQDIKFGTRRTFSFCASLFCLQPCGVRKLSLLLLYYCTLCMQGFVLLRKSCGKINVAWIFPRLQGAAVAGLFDVLYIWARDGAQTRALGEMFAAHGARRFFPLGLAI